MFASCVARTLKGQLAFEPKARPEVEATVARLDIDFAAAVRGNRDQVWTADLLWSRLRKDRILAIARGTLGETWTQAEAKQKKADIAKAMQDAFAHGDGVPAGITAEGRAAAIAWTPPGFRAFDMRTGRNGWHGIVSLLRQSVYGRLAGYEDVNDADRLGRDPAMRWIVGGKAVERGGASTSQMGRFETELLANNENLADLSYAGNTSRTIASSYPMPKRAAEQHVPKDRILKRENAEKVVTAARDFEGPLGVRVEDKRQRPPRLHDLPSLQKLCSARFGWPASKTLEVAQELYDGAGKKILTYPGQHNETASCRPVGTRRTLG